jgi:hypothetical protein
MRPFSTSPAPADQSAGASRERAWSLPKGRRVICQQIAQRVRAHVWFEQSAFGRPPLWEVFPAVIMEHVDILQPD